MQIGDDSIRRRVAIPGEYIVQCAELMGLSGDKQSHLHLCLCSSEHAPTHPPLHYGTVHTNTQNMALTLKVLNF